MSNTIENNSVVTMHYKLTDEQGAVLDVSESSKPLKYLHGAKNIIKGLETALVGKSQGDKVNVTVSPSDGYGEINPKLIQVIPRSSFDGVEKIEVGMGFEAQGENGKVDHIVVKEIDGDDITIDGNHPLAGATLNFDVEIVDVRKASDEEVSHGHVH